MNPFYENPFVEGALRFYFGESDCGATRYEKWNAHIYDFQIAGKKAVDFLYADHRNEILFVTEIKDFFKITRQGKFKDGLYSEELEDNFVSKVQDTLNGLKSILSSDKATVNEKNFCGQTAYYQIHAVFHWEFEASKKRAVRLNAMSYMKQKLRQRMNQTNIKVHVQNIADNPSKCWQTVRAE